MKIEIDGKVYGVVEGEDIQTWNIITPEGTTLKLVESEFRGKSVFAFDPELAHALGVSIYMASVMNTREPEGYVKQVEINNKIFGVIEGDESMSWKILFGASTFKLTEKDLEDLDSEMRYKNDGAESAYQLEPELAMQLGKAIKEQAKIS